MMDPFLDPENPNYEGGDLYINLGEISEDILKDGMKSFENGLPIDSDSTQEVACIKCGRCVDVCPMELKPLHFAKFADEGNWAGMKEQNVMDCVECRCCEYICSSKIPLVSKIKAGKAAVREMK
jgi:electron transport complex protein RnfC